MSATLKENYYCRKLSVLQKKGRNLISIVVLKNGGESM